MHVFFTNKSFNNRHFWFLLQLTKERKRSFGMRQKLKELHYRILYFTMIVRRVRKKKERHVDDLIRLKFTHKKIFMSVK